MFAMELNGAHIGKSFKATWRFPSWSAKRPDTIMTIPKIYEVKHKNDGKVHVQHARVPKPEHAGKPDGGWVYNFTTKERNFDPEQYDYHQLTDKTILPFDAQIEEVNDNAAS